MTKEEKALLDTLAYCEGTLGVSNNGYDVVVGYNRIIAGWTKDTNIVHGGRDWYDKSTNSTAAGRYQFVYDTWVGNDKKNLPMTKENQDQRGLQLNFERIGQILSVIDSMSGKWNQESFFKDLQKRIAYGVPAHLVELCQLPNIGKVRAKKLFDMGFKNIESIVEMDDKKLKGILNMKEEYITEIKKQAMKLSSL